MILTVIHNYKGDIMSKKIAYVTGGMGGIGTSICQRVELHRNLTRDLH
jgi:isocitrate dehydrogenase